ncbi:hypothetical protein LJB84_01435 [Bacteroidales bacterium OttesenSCG-928-J19]|nr:hypothetical protein [Bacteroidales bacterium OttesenSCG-928-J19]
MIENILKLVKSTVAGSMANDANIPQAQQKDAIEATTTALSDGLKQNLTLDNMGNLMSLFGGDKNTAQSNPVTKNLQSTVSSALMSKIGLSKSIADTISSTVVPMVISTISGKVNDSKEESFNLESLIGAFTGSDSGSSSTTGGLLSGLGKLLGK